MAGGRYPPGVAEKLKEFGQMNGEQLLAAAEQSAAEQMKHPLSLHQRLQRKWWYRVPTNHSKPVYQFLGIGLGASMWFWVRFL